jgi:hypothetical protein
MPVSTPSSPTRLQVSTNARYLVDQDGQPFFYLGDTCHTIFKRLYREEADEVLQTRAEQGFSVIQAYILRTLTVPNLYGDLTLMDGDPEKPNEPFFRNIDYIVDSANAKGLAMGLVTTWGEHVRQHVHNEAIFTPANAFAYGRYLGRRYRDNMVVWFLGGDRPPSAEDSAIWGNMALGLKEGCQGTQLVAYHGPGSWETPSSSYWFHDEDWLDFNTIQSGHGWGVPCYKFVSHDYELTPVKPTFNMEPQYEDHPDVRCDTRRRINAQQVREALYWSMLAGAFGHTYGCIDIYQFYDPDRTPYYAYRDRSYGAHFPTTHWREALHFEGALSACVARRFFELRPWYNLVPDQSLVAGGQGEGEDHVQAARAADGSFAIAYLPRGKAVSLRMDAIQGTRVKAQWFDPRTGGWFYAGEYDKTGIKEFSTYRGAADDDWVLVLEDAALDLPVGSA